MSESQAQRTLVKSPPELWEELSDPAALTRHLGELGGEIRITRLVPEKTVVWEGERASGTVELTASGWGTKVTLTVQPQAEEEGADLAAAVGAEAPADAPVISEPSPAEPAADGPEAPADDPQIAESVVPHEQPTADASEVAEPPARRPGFFRRLFGRRRDRTAATSQPAPDAHTEVAPPVEAHGDDAPTPDAEPQSNPPSLADLWSPSARQPSAPEPPAAEEPAPAPATPTAHDPLPSADPAGAQARPAGGGPEDTAALLSSVLDALGAAHHRPFSRS